MKRRICLIIAGIILVAILAFAFYKLSAGDSFEKTLTGISKYSSGGISHTIYVRTAFGEKKAFGLTVYPD